MRAPCINYLKTLMVLACIERYLGSGSIIVFINDILVLFGSIMVTSLYFILIDPSGRFDIKNELKI